LETDRQTDRPTDSLTNRPTTQLTDAIAAKTESNDCISKTKETVDFTLATDDDLDNLKHTTNHLQISKLPTLKLSFLNHVQNRSTGQPNLKVKKYVKLIVYGHKQLFI
jgi:hypothetical protein